MPRGGAYDGLTLSGRYAWEDGIGRDTKHPKPSDPVSDVEINENEEAKEML